MQKEQALVDAFNRCEKEAHHEIYELYAELLVHFAMTFSRSRQDAEDVVHEAFIKVFTRRNRDFESLAAINSFLHTVVYNDCCNLIKRKRLRLAFIAEKEYLAGEGEIPISHKLIAKEQTDFITRLIYAIDQLPPQMSRAVYMRLVQRLDIEEIATALEIKVQTAHNCVYDGKKKLKEVLGPLYEKLEKYF